MISVRLTILAFVLASCLMLPNSAGAGIISSTPVFRASPEGAWSYSESPQFQAPGLSTTYYPTSTAEFSNAVFQGYVVPDPVLSAITGGDTWLGNGLGTFQIFSTFILSEFDQTVGIAVAGDDGHSLFVDDTFIEGTGFGGAASYDLVLQAGVARRITLAGYNGPDNWVFVIGSPVSLPLPGTNPQFFSEIEDIPGTRISADGNFVSAVPEPTSITLLGLGGLCLLSGVYRRRSHVHGNHVHGI